MIFIVSAKYLIPEFQVEFGKLPPSFLPLGHKRLYEYQAKLFESCNEEIILTLPNSFVVDDFDLANLQKRNIQILYVPDGLSLGESIVYALNMKLPINESIHILHGDTYLSELHIKQNAMGVTIADNSYEWEYLSNQYGILNNDISYDQFDNMILSGYFHIQNPYYFMQSIIRNNYSYIDGIKLYSQSHPFNITIQDSWLDFGLVASYLHAKQTITTQRIFNKLDFKDGFCIKSSSLDSKISGEINWFCQFPSELKLNIPLFFKLNESSYKTEYLYLNSLAEIFVFGRLPKYTWKKILHKLKYFLDCLHKRLDNDLTPNFDYSYKTLKRLQEFCNTRKISLAQKFSLFSCNSLKITMGGGG